MEIAVTTAVVKKCSTCIFYKKTEYECKNPQFRGAVALDSFCINHSYKYWQGTKPKKRKGRQ
jgi:hypothetical protein